MVDAQVGVRFDQPRHQCCRATAVNDVDIASFRALWRAIGTV
ncbi:MAG: hypothetical protein R3C10_06835 [Pirellulales bacterium]